MSITAAAAVVLWRVVKAHAGEEALEVYLVHRAERVLFMPGFWAFPGGKVDASDAAAGDVCEATAAQYCARRELFEEVGTWTWDMPPHGEAVGARRRALLAGDNASLPPITVEPASRPMRPFAAFVTPHFGGVRFAARYFSTVFLPGDNAEVWPGELQTGAFWRPAAALALHAQGLMFLAPPVMACLEALVRAGQEKSGEAQIEAAKAHLQDAQLNAGATSRMVPRVVVAPVRSPTLPPSTHTNCYVLGQQQLAVVDPGTPYPKAQAELVGYLQRQVHNGAKVTQVWLTHHHADHVGAAMLLRQQFGAKVMAHADTAKRLQGQVVVDAQVVDDQALAVGDDVYLALHTPGHAHGHLCFYDRRRGHLLSGDNVLGMGTSIVMPRPEGDMQAYIHGLERLLTLRLGLLLPGHGPPAALSERRVADTLRQRYAREQMLLDLLGKASGPITVQALVGKLYRGMATHPTSLAAMSCMAHVEKLLQEKRLERRSGEGLDAQVVRPRRMA